MDPVVEEPIDPKEKPFLDAKVIGNSDYWPLSRRILRGIEIHHPDVYRRLKEEPNLNPDQLVGKLVSSLIGAIGPNKLGANRKPDIIINLAEVYLSPGKSILGECSQTTFPAFLKAKMPSPKKFGENPQNNSPNNERQARSPFSDALFGMGNNNDQARTGNEVQARPAESHHRTIALSPIERVILPGANFKNQTAIFGGDSLNRGEPVKIVIFLHGLRHRGDLNIAKFENDHFLLTLKQHPFNDWASDAKENKNIVTVVPDGGDNCKDLDWFVNHNNLKSYLLAVKLHLQISSSTQNTEFSLIGFSDSGSRAGKIFANIARRENFKSIAIVDGVYPGFPLKQIAKAMQDGATTEFHNYILASNKATTNEYAKQLRGLPKGEQERIQKSSFYRQQTGRNLDDAHRNLVKPAFLKILSQSPTPVAPRRE